MEQNNKSDEAQQPQALQKIPSVSMSTPVLVPESPAPMLVLIPRHPTEVECKADIGPTFRGLTCLTVVDRGQGAFAESD